MTIVTFPHILHHANATTTAPKEASQTLLDSNTLAILTQDTMDHVASLQQHLLAYSPSGGASTHATNRFKRSRPHKNCRDVRQWTQKAESHAGHYIWETGPEMHPACARPRQQQKSVEVSHAQHTPSNLGRIPRMLPTVAYSHISGLLGKFKSANATITRDTTRVSARHCEHKHYMVMWANTKISLGVSPHTSYGCK